MQCAHFVASIGISLLQNGQILVEGASSAGFLPRDKALLMVFIKQNRMKAIIMKFTTEDKNAEP